MKKILVMTMAMLAMAFAFTSCGDDDDDVPGGGGSSANTVRRVYIFDNGNEYLNRQYKLTIGSETKVLKLNELKKETSAPESVETKAGGDLKDARKKGTVDIYSYDIPATMHGDAHFNSDFSIKDGVELPETTDVLIAAFIGVGDGHYISVSGNFFYLPGLLKEKVKEYIDRRNASTFGSCVVK